MAATNVPYKEVGKNAGTQTPKKTAKQAAIQAALTAGDYSAWVKAIGANNPLAKKITADNFSQYVQYKQLMKEGKYSEAQTIGQQLGIVKVAKTKNLNTNPNKKIVKKNESGEKGLKKGWTKKTSKTNTVAAN